MRFWDREKEVKDLKAHIESEPNSILFVYGPKSSGKSTLLYHVVRELSKRKMFVKKYDVYWYDLRGVMISTYNDVVELFFEPEDKEGQKVIKEAQSLIGIPNVISFSVKSAIYNEIKNKEIDPFKYMEAVLRQRRKKHIIVFDELQRLKDVYINGERKVVDALFNFFVRLTKVLHLSHVIVMTSDTFFIEEVYTSSSLKNTSIYYLVDYFDDETARKILVEEGLSEEDADYIVNMAGGVPWVMAEVTSNGDPREKVENLYLSFRSRLRETFGQLYEISEKLRDECKDLMKKMLKGYTPEIDGKDRKCVKLLVEREVLYYDPMKGDVRFQTKLDEKAAKELLVN